MEGRGLRVRALPEVVLKRQAIRSTTRPRKVFRLSTVFPRNTQEMLLYTGQR